MNMFSMKPKFDLAAFLAEPAPVGARRRRNTRTRGMQFQSGPKAEPTAPAAPAEDATTGDKKDT
jgi:hypothetical protein